MVSLVLPADYGYIFAVVAATGLVGQWQGFLVNKYRSQAKVLYPNAYASAEQAEKDPKAKTFNCAQRAHQNTVENLPYILTSVVLNGLVHPRLTAAFGATWLLGRILYTTGYIESPKARSRGTIGYIGILGLFGTSVTIAYKMISAALL